VVEIVWHTCHIKKRNNMLLTEYRPFQVDRKLVEASIKKNKPLTVTGVLQRANAKNQNERVYPKDILAREMRSYMEGPVAEKRALGELDHPESSVVNLNNVSHNILKMWWEGDDLKGAVQILETPSGKILKSLFDAGITLGISSRGLGSVKELYKESAVEVQEDFELICFDFVSNPSTHGAFLRPMTESVNKTKQNNYLKVNKIITSILCDDGKCRILP